MTKPLLLLLPLPLLVACGQPFINVTPPNHETIIDDLVRRVSTIEQTKVDAGALKPLLEEHERRIRTLEAAPKPAPAPTPTTK